MIKINVVVNNINWLQFIKSPNNYIERKIQKINLKEKKFKKIDIFCTLLLSSDKEIIHLNKKFRKKNQSTDILSFPFHPKFELEKKLIKEREIYIGDIIINLNKIKNKKILKNFKIEFDRLWIHGLLHLLGYDHKKDKDFSRMNRVEKKYLKFSNE